MRKTLIVVVFLLFVVGNAWAQNSVTKEEEGRDRFIVQIGLMQPVIEGDTYGIAPLIMSFPVFRYKEVRLIAPGFGAAFFGHHESRDSMFFVLYPASVRVARLPSTLSGLASRGEIDMSVGVTLDWRGNKGLIFGFTFGFPWTD